MGGDERRSSRCRLRIESESGGEELSLAARKKILRLPGRKKWRTRKTLKKTKKRGIPQLLHPVYGEAAGGDRLVSGRKQILSQGSTKNKRKKMKLKKMILLM